MKTINKTLKELDESGANDFARATVRDETTLFELYQQLRDLVDAVPNHGHEGLSRCYQWDEITSAVKTREIERRGFPRLTDKTRLRDVRYRWISCWPATGGNEGHYVHVDLVWQRDTTRDAYRCFCSRRSADTPKRWRWQG